MEPKANTNDLPTPTLSSDADGFFSTFEVLIQNIGENSRLALAV